MTVWITGANGFIGHHLARALADTGQSVHGIGHGVIPHAEVRRIGLGEWVSGDVEGDKLALLAVRTGPPTLIYHLAGGSSVGLSIAEPREDFVRTVAATAQLLEWMRLAAPACRLVAASSAAVYGAAHQGPISESAALAPISPYGQHKRMMEQLLETHAAKFGVCSVAVRLFSVFGPDLRKQLLWDMCSRLHSGKRTLVLGGTGAEIRDWTEIRDVVRLLTLLGSRTDDTRFRVLNGGSGVGTTVAAIAEELLRQWGGDSAVRFSGATRPGDPFSLIADNTRIRSLGFQWQTPLAKGVEEYVRWFKNRA